MKHIHLSLSLISALWALNSSGLAHAFAQRLQNPSLEETLLGAMDGILLALPEVAADSNCRAPSYIELFPRFRGRFDDVRNFSTFPPTVLNHFSVIGQTVNNQTIYPPDYSCHQRRGSSCWQTVRTGNFASTEANL
jgi:hypothetical protein